MTTRQVWKVHDCVLDGQKYKVKVCFSESYCEKQYEESEYSCEKGTTCGENYFQSSNLAKGKVKGISNFKAFDGGIFLSIPFDRLATVDSSLIPDTEMKQGLPVVVYSAGSETEGTEEIRKKMKMSGIPSNSVILALKKNNETHQLVGEEIQESSLATIFRSTSRVAGGTDSLLKNLKELVAKEMTSCPN